MLRTNRCIKLTTFFALAVLLAAPLYAAPATGGVADVLLGTTQVDWVPTNSQAAFSLVISGPDGIVEREFAAGETPTFSLANIAGNVDGSYSWQLTATPELSGESRRLMAQARAEGTTFTPADLPSRDQLVQSGHFRVTGGAIIRPSGETEPRLAISAGPDSVASASGEALLATAADQVIADDLIVDGSACIGMDCVNGENFGFDTLRLKENNTRLKFQDTSSSGSFPSNDWQLTANESDNGGANKFSIDDIDGGRTPFTILAGAPSNSLYVHSSGRLGLGTNLPVVEIHSKNGDSPTLRLEQDGSSGFASQIWDVAGNETNFFVRDVTNGSALPFKIIPGAPTNALYVAASGNVGLSTASPDANLDIESASQPTVRLTDVGGETWDIQVTPGGNLTYASLSTATNLLLNNNGRLTVNSDTTGALTFDLGNNGDLLITGDLTANGTNYPSSRTLKEGFSAVDNREMLQRLARVPVSVWTYKSDAEGRRHIGPVTEDFSAAFDFLEVDGKLNTIDLHGVALAAIQGLNEEVQEKEARIAELETATGYITELEERIAALETLLHQGETTSQK